MLAQRVESGLHDLEGIRLRYKHPDGNLPGADVPLTPDDEKLLPPEIVNTVRQYEAGIQDLHEEVTSPEALEKLTAIAKRFVRQDENAMSENIEELRDGMRRRIIFDFDGTISDASKYRGDATADPLLGASDPLDFYIAKDRSKFKYAAAYWQEAMNMYPEIFEDGGKTVPFRDGMQELLERILEDPNIDVTIMTTNFEPFMKGAMTRIKGSERIELYCVKGGMPSDPNSHGDLRSSAKGDLVKKIAIDHADSLLEYVGDSSSDMPALEAFPVIAAYHTVDGLSFDQKMNEKGMAHLPFKDGDQLGKNLGVKLPQAA